MSRAKEFIDYYENGSCNETFLISRLYRLCDEFEEKSKDLKCCGNCIRMHSVDMGDYSHEACGIRHTESSKICQHWKYDELKNKDRV